MQTPTPARARRCELFACLALMLAGLFITYRPVVLDPNNRANVGMGDAWSYFGPNAYYLDRSLHRGEFPLWNPLVLCGVPFAANPQAKAFYPPNLVRSALTFGKTPAATHRSMKLLLAFHMLVAGLGTYSLARAQRLSKFASLLVAYAFVFGASFVRRACAYHFIDVVAWLPWVLLFVERACTAAETRDRTRNIVFGAFALALSALAGYPQLTIYAGLTAGAYVFLRQLDRGPVADERGGFSRNVAAFVVISVVAVLLAAADLLPAAQLFELSNRTSRTAVAGETRLTALSLHQWLQLVVFFAGPAAQWPGLCSGALLVLVLSGVWTVKRRRAAMWVLMILPLIDLSLGPPMPLSSIVGLLSPFQLVSPGRAFLLLSLPLCMLAGFGAEALIRPVESLRARGARIAYAALIAAALIALMWQLRGDDLALFWFDSTFSMHAPTVALIAPSFIVAAAVFGLLRRPPRGAAAFALVAVVAEFGAWNARYVPHLLTTSWAKRDLLPDLNATRGELPAANARHVTDLPNSLMYQQEPTLVGYEPAIPVLAWQMLSAAGEMSAYARTVTTLDVMLNNGYGAVLLRRPFWLARGYSQDEMPTKDESFVPDAVAFVSRSAKLTMVSSAAPSRTLLGARGTAMPLLESATSVSWAHDLSVATLKLPVGPRPRVLSVTYTSDATGQLYPAFIDATSGHASFAGLRPIAATSTPETVEFPIPDAVQDAITLHATTESSKGALRILRVEAIVDAADESALIHIERWTSNTVTVRVDPLPSPRLLLFTDTDFPGWRVRVDGKSVPIIRADHAYKAVELAAGAHEVRFLFVPIAVIVGVIISGATFAGGCALLLRLRKPRAAAVVI